MKITDISISDFGKLQNCQLNHLGGGLNVIHGEKNSGKSTVRSFLRGILQEPESRFASSTLNGASTSNGMSVVAGSIDAIDGNSDAAARIRLNCVSDHNGLRVETESLDRISSNLRRDHFARRVDTNVYDQILNVGFRDDVDESRSLTSVLHNRFRVPFGRIEQPKIDETRIRKLETSIARSRKTVSEMTSRREFLLREIRELDHRNVGEIENIDCQIVAITDRIRETEASIDSMQRRLREQGVTIEELRVHIERLRNQVETVRVNRKVDRMPEMLSRLDAVEQQILRWRKVHQDVQSQRNKLRDEMVAWSSEDLSDRDLLPFEDVRELLNSLEARVGDLDGYVASLSDQRHENSQHVIPGRHDTANGMQKTLGSMREELYQLCRELNSQHLVYRRKTTVNELKQLRRCHVEVTDHVKRLVARRESLLAEIGRIDPARAELIIKSQHELCDCNYHDQYLADRQVEVQEAYVERRVDVDVSAELARLHQLEDDRRRLHADLDAATAELNDLVCQREELISRREGLKRVDVESLRSDLSDVERRLSAEQVCLDGLLRELAEASRVPEVRPNALLDSASRYLTRLSGGDLQQVWISETVSRSTRSEPSTSGELVATDRSGQAIEYPELSREGRDQVRLAICLAATNALHADDIHLPLILDDVMVNMDETSRRDAAAVLHDYCRDNRQVIVFTRQRSVADTLTAPAVKVIEMPLQREAVAPIRYEKPQPAPSRYERPVERTVEPRVVRSEATRSARTTVHAYDYIEPDHISTRSLVDATRFLRDDTPIRAAEPDAESNIDPVTVRRSTVVTISEATHLADTRLMGNDNISILRRLGVRTVGDLLNFDPTTRSEVLSEAGIDIDQIDAWQSQSLLMLIIPQLRATDAVMLYNCGLTDADSISSLDVAALNSRIREYTSSTRGRRMFGSGYSYDKERIGEWISSARSNRDQYRSRRRWHHRDRNSNSSRSSSDRDRQQRDYEPRNRESRDRRRSISSERSDRDYGPREYAQRDQSSREQSSRDFSSREYAPRAYQPRESEQREYRQREDDNNSETSLKFYLGLDDNVEAAPSIGPRMAARLEKIGIVTVRDLLESTPENVVGKLDYKRVKVEDVRAWQQQATLVCRIPKLRGHDAQFLVACDIADPDKLAAMQPAELYKIVGPFSKTKEGQKICRSGKAPDLAEVTDWIDWSKQTRRLNAA